MIVGGAESIGKLLTKCWQRMMIQKARHYGKIWYKNLCKMSGTEMDRISREARSRNMSHIRSRHTAPEMVVRRLVHSLGYRYRLHEKSLPGQPDIYLKRHRAVVFVHGCFWHQHRNCRFATKPKSRVDFWLPKLMGNVERDEKNHALLRKMGLRVLTIWECETGDTAQLIGKIKSFMEKAE